MARSATRCCDGCGRKRKLTYPTDADIRFYGLCSECLPRVREQSDISTLRAERREREKTNPKPRYRKAYPCIGGPLDGEHAATQDFYRDGMYEHLADEYASYNSGGSFGGGRASMIFVHSNLIKPVVSARLR